MLVGVDDDAGSSEKGSDRQLRSRKFQRKKSKEWGHERKPRVQEVMEEGTNREDLQYEWPVMSSITRATRDAGTARSKLVKRRDGAAEMKVEGRKVGRHVGT